MEWRRKGGRNGMEEKGGRKGKWRENGGEVRKQEIKGRKEETERGIVKGVEEWRESVREGGGSVNYMRIRYWKFPCRCSVHAREV